MDLQLNNKLALVTGSTAGIGYAIAEVLASEGARVIVNGRSQKSVNGAIAQLGPNVAGELLGFAGDLSSAEAAEQLAISRGLAEAVAGTGITVNSVLPGPTKSRGVGDFVEELAKKEGKSFEEFETEFFQKVRPTSLIKRFATPNEVASLVAYIVSPLASATTGAALRVDGGVIKSAF